MKHFVENYIAMNAGESPHRWWENWRHQKGFSTKNIEISIEGVIKQQGSLQKYQQKEHLYRE